MEVLDTPQVSNIRLVHSSPCGLNSGQSAMSCAVQREIMTDGDPWSL